MKRVSGSVKLDLAQYREMAMFTQFSSDLDESTKKFLDKGERLVELLKQPQYHPMSNAEQVAAIYLGVHDYLADLDVGEVTAFEAEFLQMLKMTRSDLLSLFDQEVPLTDEQTRQIDNFTRGCLEAWRQDHPKDNS